MYRASRALAIAIDRGPKEALVGRMAELRFVAEQVQGTEFASVKLGRTAARR